jgi:hypothetical protein
VLACVLILGRVTASHVPALETHAQVNPSVSIRTQSSHTFVGGYYFNFVQMYTLGGHS